MFFESGCKLSELMGNYLMKTEDGRRETEDGRPETGDRRQKTEVGSWKLAL